MGFTFWVSKIILPVIENLKLACSTEHCSCIRSRTRVFLFPFLLLSQIVLPLLSLSNSHSHQTPVLTPAPSLLSSLLGQFLNSNDLIVAVRAIEPGY